MNSDSKSLRIKRALLIVSIFIIIMLFIPQISYHIPEENIENTIKREVSSMDTVNTDDINIQFLQKENKSALLVYTFTYSANHSEGLGSAILEKQLFLPLYKIDSIYLGKPGHELEYIDAVETFKAIYLVKFDGEVINISLEKELLGDKVKSCAAIFFLICIAALISRRDPFSQ